MKTVVIVGVFTEGSSNNGVASAFERIGWRVVRLPYREMAASIGGEAASYSIIGTVKSLVPDLVLFCKFNAFSSEVIRVCSEVTKTCLWFMDSFGIAKMNPEIISHCHRASFSVHWPPVAKELTKLNIPNCYGLVEGCDETEYHPVASVPRYKADISFIGTKNWRHMYVEALENAGFTVKTYGDGYRSSVFGDDFNKVCCSSKAVLNIPTYPGPAEYFSDRLIKTMATGSVSLTLFVDGLDKYFSNGSDILWFNDVDECVSVFSNNIDNVSDIGSKARETVVNNHTDVHFVKKLLQFGGLAE